jgi:hypothetical protein
MIHYLVNNKQFFNPYLARYESFKSRHPLEFYCNDAENDLLDWTQEPEQSFEELMDQHAHKLRNKYERLILCWSGGTDSHTIYNVFTRNRIHIDEIIIKYSKDIWNVNPVDHVDWMMKNHWDPTTQITAYDEYDASIRKPVLHNDDWLFQDLGNLYSKYYTSASGGPELTFLCERNHHGHNWGVVVGFEKPFVSYANGRWYSRQRDQILLAAMGQDRLECFYLDPVINLKQSHMAKRVLKQFKNAPTEARYNGRYSSNADAYRIWATVVGRHQELSAGISAAQKQAIIKIHDFKFDPTINVDDINLDSLETGLAAKLKQQDSTAVNFIQGWYNLASNKEFYRWLNDNCFNQPNKILEFKSIWSKGYDLGP